MSRSVNYNTLKGYVEDIEEFIENENEDSIMSTVQKIKKKKRFDDGTPIKNASKKVKPTIRTKTDKN